MADLPKDTLYDIFSRIPIKSLARLRCVCKQWRKYSNDPHLADIYHVKEEPKPIRIVPIKSSSNPSKQPLSSVSFLSIIKEDIKPEIQVKRDLSSRFLVNRFSIYQEYIIQGYCNGLIALVQQHHRHHNGSTFVVINPLTKESHELPPMKHSTIGQGLGFDSSTNTFKMVCLFLKKPVVVGSLKGENIGTLVHVLGTDSWREILQVPFYHINGEAVYANGRLYWFPVRIASHKLVWLDMEKEEFGLIELPKDREGWISGKLIDLNGELGFVGYLKGTCYRVVWILKHEEWMIHRLFENSGSNGFDVLGCWNKDGDILMAPALGLRLFVYRLKSGSLHSLIGPADEGLEHILICPGKEKAEVRMYQSSLLSIRKWH